MLAYSIEDLGLAFPDMQPLVAVWCAYPWDVEAFDTILREAERKSLIWIPDGVVADHEYRVQKAVGKFYHDIAHFRPQRVRNIACWYAVGEEEITSACPKWVKSHFPLFHARARDIVRVQPMTSPSAAIFYLDYVYGSIKDTAGAISGKKE